MLKFYTHKLSTGRHEQLGFGPVDNWPCGAQPVQLAAVGGGRAGAKGPQERYAHEHFYFYFLKNGLTLRHADKQRTNS